VLGYCVRCRAKQEMLSATRTMMKNGRRAMIGVCACCGTRMSVMGKWDDDAESRAEANAEPTGANCLTAPAESG